MAWRQLKWRPKTADRDVKHAMRSVVISTKRPTGVSEEYKLLRPAAFLPSISINLQVGASFGLPFSPSKVSSLEVPSSSESRLRVAIQSFSEASSFEVPSSSESQLPVAIQSY